MAFHDIRLPTSVERGAEGGPGFKTTIFELASGAEQRNIDWSRSRGEWDIGYGIQYKEDFSLVIDFFYARHGRAHSFRFKDWSDFEMTRQEIGTTNGTSSTFQLYKRYSSGAYLFDRVLEKPRSTGVLAWVNGVAQTVVYDVAPALLEVSVATDTGAITVGATHQATSGQSIEIECEFDVPVRFDKDRITTNMVTFEAGSIPKIVIKEVRGET